MTQHQQPLRETQSRIPLKRIYGPEDVKDIVYERDLGDAGSYPFTRGSHPDMFRARPWITRALSGESTPRETNRRLRILASQGQTGIDVVGDAPTLAYIDSDHPLAAKTVGTQGVPLCCLQDYREMLEGLPLDKVTLSWSAPYCFAIAGLAIVAEENGVSWDKLRGSTVLNTLFMEDCGYATRLPLEARVRASVDCIEFCCRHLPNFHAFLEDVYYISEAALDAIEEIALALVEARFFINEAVKRGMGIDDFAPRIAILVTARMDFFEEIAKFRALRRIWARMMKEEYKAAEPRSWRPAITVHTSGLSLTAQQPVNNIVRGAYEALAAVLGGCQAVEVSCFDEPYRTPSVEAATVSLRTQQMIAYETRVTAVVDPLGGSYFIEALTSELEEKILERVREIEGKGDIRALVERGYFRTIFESAMRRYQEDIASGWRKVVGVNVFRVPAGENTLLRESVETRIEVAREQIDKIRELKGRRNGVKMKEVLNTVHKQAKRGAVNLVPVIMEAFKRDATMGEITGAIRLAYGSPYDPFEMIPAPL